MNIYITKEDIWTANNYVKKGLLSYIIRGLQIKTIFKYLYVPIEWLKKRKKTKNTNSSNDVEQREVSPTVSRNWNSIIILENTLAVSYETTEFYHMI